jgi:hypothetical protein
VAANLSHLDCFLAHRPSPLNVVAANLSCVDCILADRRSPLKSTMAPGGVRMIAAGVCSAWLGHRAMDSCLQLNALLVSHVPG